MVHRARQPDAPYEGDFACLPGTIEKSITTALTTRYDVRTRTDTMVDVVNYIFKYC